MQHGRLCSAARRVPQVGTVARSDSETNKEQVEWFAASSVLFPCRGLNALLQGCSALAAALASHEMELRARGPSWLLAGGCELSAWKKPLTEWGNAFLSWQLLCLGCICTWCLLRCEGGAWCSGMLMGMLGARVWVTPAWKKLWLVWKSTSALCF